MHNQYNQAFLSAQRNIGDTEADVFVTHAFPHAEQKAALYNWLKSLQQNTQLAQLPDEYAHYQFMAHAAELPAWANAKLMRSGAAFFACHAQAIINLLGLLSLPYCYAAADGAMVLYLSNRIRSDIGRRLSETGEFVWNVMAPGAFEPEGKGFTSCLNIRLTHAAARYYTLKSGKWNEAWGVPINQEDMAGTNLSFSLIVIRGLRKLGYAIAYEDQQAFIHLWNVVGYLLGLQQSLLPRDGKQAYNLEEAIRTRLFKASAQGQALASSLINYFTSVSSAAYFSSAEVIQLIRYLLGDDIADLLNLPATAISAMQLRLVKTLYLVSELKVPANAAANYQSEYGKFKKVQARFLKT